MEIKVLQRSSAWLLVWLMLVVQGLVAQNVTKPGYLSNWASFTTATMAEQPAAVVVDLGLARVSPVAGYPYQCSFLIKFKQPDSTGINELKSPEILGQIEDKLTTAINRGGGIYYGTVTAEGWRDYYFFLPDSAGFRATCKQVMAAFPGYSFNTQVEVDPFWFNYYGIFPDEYTQQIQYNEMKLEELWGEGDSLTKPRYVEHFANFPSTRDRDGFEKDVIRYGFTVIGKGENEGDLPFGILFSRKHAVDKENIEIVTLQLVDLAMKNGGYYDGWECEAVR